MKTAARVTTATDVVVENGYQCFVPGVFTTLNRSAVEAALSGVPDFLPLLLALTGGGRIKMEPVEVKKGTAIQHAFDLPVPAADWGQLYMEPVVNEAGVKGLLIRLPGHLACLHAAWTAYRTEQPYSWTRFLIDYQRGLGEGAGDLLARLENSRFDGIQMQSDADPRLAPEIQPNGKQRYFVGMGPETARWFLAGMRERHPDLEGRESLAGAMLLLVRFPTVYRQSGIWVEVVILTDRPEGKIYHDPVVWAELQDGDDDGDLAYLGIGRQRVRFQPERALPVYPELVLGANEVLLAGLVELKGVPSSVETDVLALRNARLKELTGTITYVMKSLGYTYANRQAEQATDVAGRVAAKIAAFHEAYAVASVLVSGALDMKKEEGAKDGVARFAQAMQAAMTGKLLDIRPFAPFLPAEKHPGIFATLEKMVAATTDSSNQPSLRAARESAYGQYVVSANHLTRSGGFIVDRMVGAGVPRERVWDALTEDALGITACPLAVPKPPKKRKETVPIAVRATALATTLPEIFSTLTWEGQPLFAVDGVRETADCTQVTVRFSPRWKWWFDAARPLTMVLSLPRTQALAGSLHGHTVAWLNRKNPRLYMPIFRWAMGQPVRVDLCQYLQEAVMSVLAGMNGQERAQSLRPKIQRSLQEAITRLVPSTAKERLVRRYEARVEVPEQTPRDFVVEEEIRARLLAALATSGWDILTTSKNHPGTVVTWTGKHGVPSYILAVNPFEGHDMKKRRNEKRELRLALPLATPEAPVVTMVGQAALPEYLGECITNLTVAVGDLTGVNYYQGTNGGFGYDALICCPSALKKLALRELVIVAKNETDRDALLERLEGEGLTVESVDWTETVAEDGYTRGRWEIRVAGPIEDGGKIKACVGPLKGVMSVIPVQLYDANGEAIDLVVPFETLKKKKGVSVWLTLLCQAAGITAVDPGEALESLVARLAVAIGDMDPRTVVHALHTDGTERCYPLGLMLTGQLPFFRPEQTTRQTARLKLGRRGIKMQPHAALLARDEEGNMLTWDTDEAAREAFQAILVAREELKSQVIQQLGVGTLSGARSLMEIHQALNALQEESE